MTVILSPPDPLPEIPLSSVSAALHAFDVHPPIPAAPAVPPSVSSSSLDTSKSPVDPWSDQTESQDFAFPDSAGQRRLVARSMAALDFPEKSIRRYVECCRAAMVLRHSTTNALRISYATCGSRLCPRCCLRCRQRAADLIATAIGAVRPRVWRFITLTLGSSTRSLADQLSHLTSSFRRLRQTQLWQSTQLKGYGLIEVTHNASTGLWHPHLHILSRGIYLPQRALSTQWLLCSSGSKVTDIRALSSRNRALAYVTKYLGKAPTFSDSARRPALTLEWIKATRNRKLIIPWGCRTVSYDDLPADDPEAPTGHWSWVCSLTNLLVHAREGMPEACSLVDQLRERNSFARSPPDIQVASDQLLPDLSFANPVLKGPYRAGH